MRALACMHACSFKFQVAMCAHQSLAIYKAEILCIAIYVAIAIDIAMCVFSDYEPSTKKLGKGIAGY